MRWMSLYCLWIGFGYALSDGLPMASGFNPGPRAAEMVLDEAELRVCQKLGYDLYSACVANPLPDPKGCTIKKTIYVMCLAELNEHTAFDPPITDPYVPNPFSPCNSTIAELILEQLCPI